MSGNGSREAVPWSNYCRPNANSHRSPSVLREEFAATGNATKLAELNALIDSFNLNSKFTEDYQSFIRQGQNGLNKF